MALIYDHSFFFTKPLDRIRYEKTEAEMISTLETDLAVTGKVTVVRKYRMTQMPSEEFLREFYAHARDWSGFEKMMGDYMKFVRPPTIAFYSGENITNRIINILGPTTHHENEGLITWAGRETLRWRYCNPWSEGWKNVAHAPKPSEVEEQLEILRKHNIM